MFQDPVAFIGIDPTGGNRPITYTALDSSLHLLFLGRGDVNEVLAFLGGQPRALVGVSAPQRPNQGVMDRAEVRANLSPPPRPGRWTGFRLAEYLLRQHHIVCPRTPSEEARCPTWMKRGFTLYRRLEDMGYCSFPQEGTSRWIEVYPHACYCALLGQAPFPKTSLEGRLQRQLVLYNLRLEISDPMLFFEEITRHRLLQGVLPDEYILTPAALDALAAAYTAWLVANHPEQTSLIGDPEEGQVVLPVAELKRRY